MKGCESTSKWSLLNKYPYKNQIYSFILIVFMWKLFNLVTDFLALVFFTCIVHSCSYGDSNCHTHPVYIQTVSSPNVGIN